MRIIMGVFAGLIQALLIIWAAPFFLIGVIVNSAYIGFQVGCGVTSSWANRRG